MMPTPPPITIATRVAAKPTISETRPPCISSLSMSMPPSSQPSQWCTEIGANTADGPVPQLCAVGL